MVIKAKKQNQQKKLFKYKSWLPIQPECPLYFIY